jgi:P-type E1-E2 ATPase
VPGDIFLLKGGMTIPCDCSLLLGQVILDESALTGSSLPIKKRFEGESVRLFDGTTVTMS